MVGGDPTTTECTLFDIIIGGYDNDDDVNVELVLVPSFIIDSLLMVVVHAVAVVVDFFVDRRRKG